MVPRLSINPLYAVKLAAGALVAALAFSAPAGAQKYPDKPIKIVVPWAAGGTVDVVARTVGQKLWENLGQPVVVENRGGANGTIGTNAVAKAPPDGYTLIVANAETHTIDPHVYPTIPYDAMADFVPVATLVKVPFVVATRPDLPVATMQDLVALAKAQPGKLTFGSWGIGSVPQIGMEMFLNQAGVKILHVPYNGGPPAFQALMAGQIDVMIIPAGIADPLLKTGKIKVVAATGANRYATMENIPTLKEQGYDIEMSSTLGLLVPAKTPPAVVQQLSSAIAEILKAPDVQASLKTAGTEIYVLTSDDYGRMLRAELGRWGDVIKKANIVLQ